MPSNRDDGGVATDGKPRQGSPSAANEPLRFRPAARLQYLLSEQLVSDPNVAILEFVKNSYDADASDVLIQFEFADDLERSSIIIADDGRGMDRESFDDNWMHPGYSEKLNAAPTSKKRIPVGEKGLGRLAAGRLGATLDVYTRTRSTGPWFHAHFRWEEFNDQNKLLDEIPIAWDLTSEPPVDGLGKGTALEIKGLTVKWDSRPPGRRAKGRAVTRLGRLRQDLEMLQLPLTVGGQQFDVRLLHNSSLPEDTAGRVDDDGSPAVDTTGSVDTYGAVDAPKFELLDYEYRFELKRAKNDWTLVRTVGRSPAITELTSQPATSTTTIRDVDLDDIDLDLIGPLSGSYFYAPESARVFKALRIPTGVRIYRDSVRIDPYGEPGNDWLGASERKAVRQGHAAIQPNVLYGAVSITRRHNPGLNPLANREGFIGNAALDAFFAFARREFDEFGKLVEHELLAPRWEENEARRQSEAALQSRQWAVAMTRATAHAVRQPVTSAGTALRTMKQKLDKSGELSDPLRAEVDAFYTRAQGHLARIDSAVTKMLDFLEVDPQPKQFDLSVLVTDALEAVQPDAETAGVELDWKTPTTPIELRAPAGLIEHALEELVENAIQAPRPQGRQARVTVSIDDKDGLRILVRDNAKGIDDKVYRKLFKQNVSRKGHIGVGLLINRQLMQIARGDIEVAETGSEGSLFSIMLPT